MASIQWRGNNKDIAYLCWYEEGEQIKISLGKIKKYEAEQIRIEKEAEQNAITLHLHAFLPQYLSWHEIEYPSSHVRVNQIIEQHLAPFFDYPIEAINQLELERYKAFRLTSKIAPMPDTINKELRTLNAIINRAYKWELIDKLPIRELPIIRNLESKAVHFYTSDDLETLYSNSNDFHHIWKFLANTGLRRTEYLNFNPSLNIRNDKLMIESKTDARTKSGKWRMIPLSIGAKEAMKHDYIYTGRGESLSRAFKKCRERAGLGGSLHSLRHTFASHLVMNNVPLRTVQVLLGHSKLEVTEKYAHLAPEYLADSVQTLNI